MFFLKKAFHLHALLFSYLSNPALADPDSLKERTALHTMNPHSKSHTALMGSGVIMWNDGRSKYCKLATPDVGLLALVRSEMNCRCHCDVKRDFVPTPEVIFA